MNSKHVIFGIVFLFSLLLMTGAVRDERESSEAFGVGDVLPGIKSLASVSDEATDMPAEYMLVHFWASYDGESRAENIRWQNFFASAEKVRNLVAYRAVSLDPDPAVYRRTASIDGLDKERQSHIGLFAEKIHAGQLHALSKSFHTYLVDKHGVIRAVDPSPLFPAKRLK